MYPSLLRNHQLYLVVVQLVVEEQHPLQHPLQHHSLVVLVVQWECRHRSPASNFPSFCSSFFDNGKVIF